MMFSPFTTGNLAVTPAANALLTTNSVTANELICRHRIGDWGDVDDAGKKANDDALAADGQLLSVYKLKVTGERVHVITAADRTATTIQLPTE